MSARLVVVVRVTTRCNLGCGFCAYDRGLPFERRELDRASVLALGELLVAQRKAGGLPVHLSLLGGEPALWGPLVESEPLLAEELGLSLGITTNGTTLPDPGFRARLLRYYDELTLSIDAKGALHDELRGFPRGFERLKAAVEALIEERAQSPRPLLVRVNAVLMRRTLPRFAELCRELASWGIDELTFNALGGADRPEFYAEERLLPADFDQLSKTLPLLRAELLGAEVVLRGSDAYLRRLERAARGLPLPVLDCGPGERFLFVDEQGRVSPCSFTATDYGVPLASLGRDGLAVLPQLFQKARAHRPSAECSDCRSTQVFSKWSAPRAVAGTRKELPL